MSILVYFINVLFFIHIFQRKKFLEEVVNALTIDITAEMTKSIEILSDTNRISKVLCDSDVPEEVTGAFDLLMDAIYNIDTSIGK